MKTIILLICITIIFSCKSPVKEKTKKTYIEEVYVEQFDSTNTSENRYTADNTIYSEGSVIIYDYYYQDLEGRKFKFQEVEGASTLHYTEREKAWFFVHVDSLNEETIKEILIKVRHGLKPMIYDIPDYSQTIISYQYPQVNGHKNFMSLTGAIENEKNVWVHPPRDRLFQILELNPFPYIRTPYEVGNKWKWSLRIGTHWGDSRWKTWSLPIQNEYQYEITSNKKIDTKIGQLDCFEIQSTARSRIGNTHLTAYFNLDFGFVKLDYTNIDSTKIVLEINELSVKEIETENTQRIN